MFYLIPLSLLAYKYRYQLSWYLMWSYSFLEMKYVQLTTGTTSSIAKPLDNTIASFSASSVLNEDLGIYEIPYKYMNRPYVVAYDAKSEEEQKVEIEKAQEVVQYVFFIEKGELPPPKQYRWIDVTCNSGTEDTTSLVKKYSGPFGDFYEFADYRIPKTLYERFFKDVVLTDYKLDEYRINDEMRLELISVSS